MRVRGGGRASVQMWVWMWSGRQWNVGVGDGDGDGIVVGGLVVCCSLPRSRVGEPLLEVPLPPSSDSDDVSEELSELSRLKSKLLVKLKLGAGSAVLYVSTS